MATYTEVLPPSKSEPHRAMKFTPACVGVGVLELTGSKSHVRYALAVQPFGGVRLTKEGGSENYVVRSGSCECAGFMFGRGKLCKHIEALHCLQSNGWLDDRETVRDVHAEAEEQDAWWERGEDRLEDDEHADVLGRRIIREPLGA